MTRSDGDPNVLEYYAARPSTDSPIESALQPEREVTRFSFPCPPSDMAESQYYVPAPSIYALFDAMFFQVQEVDNVTTATVWVFQMTRDIKHVSSFQSFALVYSAMREVRSVVEGQLRLAKTDKREHWRKRRKVEVEVDVAVKYVLLFPEDGKERVWHMSDGWHDKSKTMDHGKGGVYWQPIPVREMSVRCLAARLQPCREA
ncbi:hypothetical protein BV25DRAFT_1821579 [Artomyces pyxidatus]|uniref:Uncharacterized protein n=1 Tax=Artomyces pyxidatus TaxID=48021 RepID=A0ACB8TCD9_9AGAM|nr:hypothetical protein BV25DRAFT_1821579 [Artomyces pyxidatus]